MEKNNQMKPLEILGLDSKHAKAFVPFIGVAIAGAAICELCRFTPINQFVSQAHIPADTILFAKNHLKNAFQGVFYTMLPAMGFNDITANKLFNQVRKNKRTVSFKQAKGIFTRNVISTTAATSALSYGWELATTYARPDYFMKHGTNPPLDTKDLICELAGCLLAGGLMIARIQSSKKKSIEPKNDPVTAKKSPKKLIAKAFGM